MEPIEGPETSANYNRTPGKYPKEYIQQEDFSFVWGIQNQFSRDVAYVSISSPHQSYSGDQI